jgi:hypothetical protein
MTITANGKTSTAWWLARRQLWSVDLAMRL